jgi:hypothetical protein
MRFQEYFEHLTRCCQKEVETLVRKYRAIGPLLTKMEGLVVHTNSGRSPKLHPYYAYWENLIYEGLTQVYWTDKIFQKIEILSTSYYNSMLKLVRLECLVVKCCIKMRKYITL